MLLKLRKLALAILIISSCLLHGKEFRLISLDDFQDIEGFKFANNDGFKRITLKKYCLNPSYSVPKINKAYFFAIDALTKEVSKKPSLIIPFTDINKDSIVLLEKDDSTAEGMKFSIIQNDEKEFPYHSANVFNNSEKLIIIRVGKEIFKIPPKSSRNLQLILKDEGFSYDKVVFAGQRTDKSIDYFYSSYWRLNQYQKKICFIDFDQKKNRLKLIDLVF